MIRVAGLHDQVEAGITDKRRAGLNPSETIDALRERDPAAVRSPGAAASTTCCGRARRARDPRRHARRRLGRPSAQTLQERFKRLVLPVLTPLAVGLGRPFPYISNLSLSLAVLVRDPQTGHVVFARVKVPKEMLPRFMPVAEGEATFVMLEELIAANLGALFPGMEIVDHGLFRVTRDADFEVADEADDLLEAVEAELRRRPFGEVVRLEIEAGAQPRSCASSSSAAMRVEERQVYEIRGLLDMNDLHQLARLPGHAELRYEPWTPVTQPRLAEAEAEDLDMFAVIRQGDVLVHHPFDSFSTSVERFVEQAVNDPDVLAIKQTVYRTSDDSPLVPALIRATERGKQAVCLVELKARFDERANIMWARKLEEAGVHVVYGMPTLKTHAKCLLVVRREGEGVRRYVHVGTGNYHPTTARLYTDFGLFTCDERLGADVADMFNLLTGYARPQRFRDALVAPNFMLDGLLELIDRVVAGARGGPPRAHRAEDERARPPDGHRGALRRFARRRADRPQRARHLLPRAGDPGRLGEHPRRLDPRALPRALAHLLVRARRRDRGPDQLGRPDAAQPRQPRRALRADPRSRRQGRPARHARALPRRRHARLGAAPRRHVGAPRSPATPSRVTSSASCASCTCAARPRPRRRPDRARPQTSS